MKLANHTPSIPQANYTLATLFLACSQREAEKIAVICQDKKITYHALASLVCRWSQAMSQRGVNRGDHIGVLLPNSIEFVALILVAADLGAVLVPLNTSLTAAAIRKAFNATDVKHVVSTTTLLEELSRDDFPEVSGLWLAIDEAVDDIALPNIEYLSTLLSTAHHEAALLNWGQTDDALILTMTSGSTGDPKPIILTQRTKLNRVAAAIALYNIHATDITLAATPLYHSLAERLVLIPLLTGGTSVLMDKFSATEWIKHIEAQTVTFTIAVSSQLKQIVDYLPNVAPTAMRSLRCVVSSSALLESELKEKLLAKLDCDFHECYGTSEIAIASNLDGSAARTKLNSVGISAPGVDIMIIDAHDHVVAAGQPGEIVCKTTMLFGGYYKRQELTQAAMWGEYFRTGDIGTLDADGFLHFLGRKKDIIVTGGINVYPADIEAALTEHPAVLEAAAFAYPDANLGEVVAVAIVPKDAIRFDTDGELRKLRFHCAAQLADFQQPRKFFIIETLPRNSMGKLMKFQLTNRFSNTASDVAIHIETKATTS
ncbi:class I adenylate-forming enzyme family protein [Herminiimonas arsenitoxidans]|uniref:class I adenylate-forming enzyme family protein n=1 Tax=Herminiimonas arsenitoxidans TaxID=1809410 RepID=UPI000970E860|nr:class I adenylate-forming enzyme family protein [Herminiimonas arsenitoxidans]